MLTMILVTDHALLAGIFMSIGIIGIYLNTRIRFMYYDENAIYFKEGNRSIPFKDIQSVGVWYQSGYIVVKNLPLFNKLFLFLPETSGSGRLPLNPAHHPKTLKELKKRIRLANQTS